MILQFDRSWGLFDRFTFFAVNEDAGAAAGFLNATAGPVSDLVGNLADVGALQPSASDASGDAAWWLGRGAGGASSSV